MTSAHAGTQPRITLLTDFGTADGYVAAMRGVIASIAPGAIVEDASHAITPGDVHGAAWCLSMYWKLYPAGTTHIVVVDPGVGSERRAIASHVDGRFLVAPDNGVLTSTFTSASDVRIVEIEAERVMTGRVSPTFHGRDIFAPAAARLATGTPIDALGTVIDDPVLLELATPVREEGVVRGSVVHVDRFGNLITNVPAAWLDSDMETEVAGRRVGLLQRTYADTEPGRPIALIGSADVLEIAVRDGSAAVALGLRAGASVVVRPRA